MRMNRMNPARDPMAIVVRAVVVASMDLAPPPPSAQPTMIAWTVGVRASGGGGSRIRFRARTVLANRSRDTLFKVGMAIGGAFQFGGGGNLHTNIGFLNAYS